MVDAECIEVAQFQMEQFSVRCSARDSCSWTKVDRCTLELQIEPENMHCRFRSAIPLVLWSMSIALRVAQCPCLELFVVIFPMQCSTAELAVRWQLSVRCQPALGLQNKLWITTRFWALPVFTCIVIRSLGMKSRIIFLLLAHKEGLVWTLTQTSWRRLDALYLFWSGHVSGVNEQWVSEPCTGRPRV